MRFNSYLPMLSLQIFADGAAAGGTGDGGTAQGAGVTAAAAVPQMKGVKSNPLADVKYGVQEESAPAAEVQTTQTAAPPDRNAEFEKIIKGEYKDLYDARVQDTVQKRLKGTKETVERYNALAPTLELLANKYGVDVNNIDALNKAIESDEFFLKEEALKRGMSVDQYREVRVIEKENADLRKQMQEKQQKENADRLYTEWMTQAESVKNVYPSFDFRAEMSNPQFVNLLRSNVDVRTAYEVIHRDEIIPAAMQFTAKTVEQKLTDKIIAGGKRPTENGMRSQGAAVVKSDVSQLSKNDIAEIHRRVARGERISFG